MKVLLVAYFILIGFLLPAHSFAEELRDKTIIETHAGIKKTEKIDLEVGQDVKSFSTLALESGKGMLYCLAVLLLLYGFARKFYLPKASLQAHDTIKIKSKKTLSPKSCLFLIEVNSKEYLISEHQSGVTFLAQTNEADLFHEHLLEEEQSITQKISNKDS